MTFRQWLRETWIDIKYGRWHPVRVLVWDKDNSTHELLSLKCEGTRVMYDPGSKYVWFACHKRSVSKIECGSKRDAEARCAIENDLRGTGL